MYSSDSDWLPALSPGHSQQFNTGEVLCRPHDGQDRFFVLQSGRARIFLVAPDKELTIGYLQAGSLYVTHTRAWVEALEPTQATHWPIRELKQLLAADPSVALNAMQAIGTLLHSSLNIIEDLAFRSVEARLARYLLVESEQQDNLQIRLIGNTELLASLLGTSRQTVSTLINQLIKKQVIERVDRQHLKILDKEQLRQISSGMSSG